MKGVALGILVLAVLGGTTMLFLRSPSEAPADAAPSVEQVLALERQLANAEARQRDAEEALAAVEAENRALEAEATAAREAAELTAQKSGTENADGEESGEKKEARERSLDDIRELLKNNPNASAQIKALTEVMYADLLNSLDLNPEEKAELRRLLTDSLMESMALTQYALSNGDIAWSDVRGWELDERAYLDAKVRELLPPGEYETWSDYFENIDEVQLEGNLRNQIRAVASGLTPENFDYVLQVAVEEFRAQQIALEQSTHPFTLAENVNYQLRAMEAMRARLSAVLSADQLAEIENWLTMAERLLSSQLPNNE